MEMTAYWSREVDGQVIEYEVSFSYAHEDVAFDCPGYTELTINWVICTEDDEENDIFDDLSADDQEQVYKACFDHVDAMSVNDEEPDYEY
jgi:hypothetical protein